MGNLSSQTAVTKKFESDRRYERRHRKTRNKLRREKRKTPAGDRIREVYRAWYAKNKEKISQQRAKRRVAQIGLDELQASGLRMSDFL